MCRRNDRGRYRRWWGRNCASKTNPLTRRRDVDLLRRVWLGLFLRRSLAWLWNRLLRLLLRRRALWCRCRDCLLLRRGGRIRRRWRRLGGCAGRRLWAFCRASCEGLGDFGGLLRGRARRETQRWRIFR